MDDVTQDIHAIISDIFNKLSPNQTITTAESCTGGLISAFITDISGSSQYFERGFVTYSNEAKTELIGVPEDILIAHGAVSKECARAMAEGALKAAKSDYALAVTGIAGPGGGTAEKPTGLVYIGLAQKNGETQVWKNIFEGDRTQVRLSTVKTALSKLQHTLG